MLSKADHTKDFIIKTIAPIFNRNGYAATSMSDLVKATGLTKGALYGNFKSKEELAIAAFTYSIKSVLRQITDHQNLSDSPIQKLFLVSDFYRNYYDFSKELGGCPVLNIGVDANNKHPKLLCEVQRSIDKIQSNVVKLIELGKSRHEIKPTVNAAVFAKKLYTIIQGAIFMTYTMEDTSYLKSTMDQVDQWIHQELKI
ncbi:TetR/AcrR family transcriptional regulator [Aquimarina intermedia]|uniref:TetR family transcriptional regulator n=1 Tax=Aquimarina intermedia TaxID=350814 RepID=A0A5S5BYK6_9FLAO|nr:TetR/AcrR family transcriptional regulator [Aquimarina intermedia]TYP72241.1 TetR family transcriptional regulator [Aquimarina intermedia]